MTPSDLFYIWLKWLLVMVIIFALPVEWFDLGEWWVWVAIGLSVLFTIADVAEG